MKAKGKDKIPKSGLSKKDEKRKAKREKLAKKLNAKKEAEALARAKANAPPPEPVSLGDFSHILDMIERTKVQVRDPNERAARTSVQKQSIEQMKAIYNDPAFISNPMAAFTVADNQLEHNARAYHMQLEKEENERRRQKEEQK